MNLAPVRGHRGFTLIELLVVIAIIGILSAVVLASLNTARNKGADAAVKSNLQTVQTQAELFYDSNNNKYNTDGTTGISAGGACPTSASATGSMFAVDATIRNAVLSAMNAVGTTTSRCYMNSNGSAYFVQVGLKTGGTYCVDSTGQATTTNTLATGTACPS